MKNLKLKMLPMLAILMMMSIALQAQTNRIELTVKSGVVIKLYMRGVASVTPITVVSGDSTYNFNIDVSPKYKELMSNGTTMTVFGNVKSFDCENNGANITGVNTVGHTKLEVLLCANNAITDLNLSGTTLLKSIHCYENELTSIDISTLTNLEQIYFRNNNVSSLDISANSLLEVISFRDNNFTTQTLNDLYCALPDRGSLSKGKVYPTGSPSSANYSIVLASAGSIATGKNWNVWHGSDDTDVPTTGSYICPAPSANMNRYIKLNVTQGQNIKLDFACENPSTPVLIRSGASEYSLTVGTAWNYPANYYAGADTMVIYGNINRFDCQENNNYLTAVNFDKNIHLKQVYCGKNSISDLDIRKLYQLQHLSFFQTNLSVEKIDAIYCDAIDRTGMTPKGKFVPFYNAADPNHMNIINNTNKNNATSKYWDVVYFNSDPIPTTHGTYTCPNMSKYIELDVIPGQQIALNMKASADNTGIRIISGTIDTTFVVDQTLTGVKDYLAGDTKMRIYGNLTEFNCRNNNSKITAINVSNNNGLIKLLTSYNSISELYVTKLVNLKELYCIGNNLNNIDVSKCLDLEAFSCHYNFLSTLDVTKNTKLLHFYCNNNILTSLDLSGNPSLLNLGCHINNIDSLDISGNPYLQNVRCENNDMKFLKVDKFGALKTLSCYNNEFPAQVLDSVYCSLPTRNISENASIYPVNSNASPNISTVLITNAQNAKNENWTVKYKVDSTEVFTSGTYVCGDPFLTTSVTTKNASDITHNSAKINASYVKGTYDVISEKGFIWRADGGSDNNLNVSSDSLNAYLTNLEVNTLYVFKAYIKVGTSYMYGEEKTFTTTSAPVFATVTTNPATNITYASAILNGEVDPGEEIIGEKGFEWKVTGSSSYTDELISYSAGNTFSADLSGLTANASYTFRAYAKVGAIKKYGSELTFTTEKLPEVNMERWIELTVQQGADIWLDLTADAENTGVKVVSGAKDTTVVVNASWTSFKNYYAEASTMKVYGNVKEFDCSDNIANITDLDASNNIGLEILFCWNNNISSLNVNGLTALKDLDCDENNLSSLDVSGLTALKELYCYTNNISSIKISGCDSLSVIFCDGNNFTACGLDSLFHQLPIRPGSDKGEIYINNGSSTNPGALTCRDTIATNRNWEVLDYNGGSNISIVNSTYACPYFTIGIEDIMVNNVKVEIYPNPASNNLNIECGERINNLELYDELGRMLIHKENILDNTSIDVSNFDNGIYILKIRTAKGSGEYKIIVN